MYNPIRAQAYYQKNRQKILQQRKNFWVKNKKRLYKEKRDRLINNKTLYNDNLQYLKNYRNNHKESLQEYFVNYNIENRKRLIKKSARYYKENRSRLLQEKKKYHLKHRDKFNLLSQKRYKSLKPLIQKEVFGYYSNQTFSCACCGNKDGIQFLTIDHINGRDKKETKRLTGFMLQQWLKTNQFPTGFQVLCWNCNCTKGFFGQCCHKQPWVLYKYHKNHMRKLKLEILTAYSKPEIKCTCCGETEKGFLTLDHIKGKPNEHKGLRSQQIYKLLKDQDFPSGYQVLCYNCNCAKGNNKECPHKTIPIDTHINIC